MKHNDWTDRLHGRLSDYKAVSPVGLWDKIETAVDGRRKRARTVRMRVWAAAAAVALLLISGAGYLLNRNKLRPVAESFKPFIGQAFFKNFEKS